MNLFPDIRIVPFSLSNLQRFTLVQQATLEGGESDEMDQILNQIRSASKDIQWVEKYKFLDVGSSQLVFDVLKKALYEAPSEELEEKLDQLFYGLANKPLSDCFFIGPGIYFTSLVWVSLCKQVTWLGDIYLNDPDFEVIPIADKEEEPYTNFCLPRELFQEIKREILNDNQWKAQMNGTDKENIELLSEVFSDNLCEQIIIQKAL